MDFPEILPIEELDEDLQGALSFLNREAERASSRQFRAFLIDVWTDPLEYACGVLFLWIYPGYDGPVGAGCLTQIRQSWEGQIEYDFRSFAYDVHGAKDDELSALIAADERIPIGGRDIVLEDLPLFASWQQYIRNRWEEQRNGQ